MNPTKPLVTAKWLSEALSKKSTEIRVLDVSWYIASDIDRRKQFQEKHIPGAQFFDIVECCDKSSPYSCTLPPPEEFGDYVGQLGISNDTHVVIYDIQPKLPMLSSPRVWWMFRVFGHEKVSVLEGGLTTWVNEGHPVTSEITEVSKADFDVKYQSQLLARFDDMVANIDSQIVQVMDSRPAVHFVGNPEENDVEGKRTGHTPGAKNIPFINLFNAETRNFKPPEELREIYESSGIDLSRRLVASCGVGIGACIDALGAFLAGKEDVAIYDGSWQEYGQKATAEQVAKGP